jgi:DNA invertase Pin-like site-specific DNA recombinase
MTTSQTVAYIRVSGVGQNTARHLDGMTFDATFTDKCSGSDTNRPQLKAMLAHVRKGDTVVVHEISHLARNTDDLLPLVEQLTGKGVTIMFKKEGITFTGEKTNPMNQMLLTMLGAVAAFELFMINEHRAENERRAEGQAKARADDKHMGRTAKLSAERVSELCSRAAAGESKTALAEKFGISRATLYATIKAPD